MIRLVLGPDNVVTPDLAGRLPGRGAWVSADRASVETAVRKGAFARAFKTQVKVSPGLAAEIDSLLEQKLLQGLGILRRGDNIVLGFDQVRESILSSRPAALIEASDGSADGRDSLMHLLKAVHGGPDGSARPPVVGAFSGERLGMALGRARVIHACLKQGRAAKSWMDELARLSGFRPVAPAAWTTSEPGSGRPATDFPAVGARQDDAGNDDTGIDDTGTE
jgi:uncharacterized protein